MAQGISGHLATQELNHRLPITRVGQLDFQEHSRVTWEIFSITTTHIEMLTMAILLTSRLTTMIGEMTLARQRRWR